MGDTIRVLVTGSAGQLGRRLIQRAQEAGWETVAGVHTTPPSHDAPAVPLPVTDGAATRRAVEKARPDWVINAAAMTDVDACERDPGKARQVNALGAGHVARAARRVGARVLHVSTDYVYSGASAPYREADAPDGPRNAYGQSKLEGERRVLDAAPDALIARTSGVFDPTTRNFFTWAAERLAKEEETPVLTDQRLNPTLADDLAEQLVALVAADATGVHHTVGATGATRWDAAQALCRALDLDAGLLRPTTMDALGWDAERPRDTRLVPGGVAKVKPPLDLPHALQRFKEEWR